MSHAEVYILIDFLTKTFITFIQDDDQTVVEARVRYLSFLGIGKNVKNCAFIIHTAQDKFICHAFRCEPSSGALCKTIEAACKVSKTLFNVHDRLFNSFLIIIIIFSFDIKSV